MNKTLYALDINEKKNLNEICQPLLRLGLNHIMMHLIFNDGSQFSLSSIGSCLEETDDVQALLQSNDQGYFLYEKPEIDKISFNKNHFGCRIYNLIRQHTECTFVFSAISDKPPASSSLLYEKTVKKFELISINFVDMFLSVIIEANTAYRFSFVLNNKALRHAIIRQGYEQTIMLSAREKECLWYAGQGKSSKEIGQLLQISPYTVEQYLKRIRDAFNCNTLPEIIMECIHRGIIGKVSYFHTAQPSSFLRHSSELSHNKYVA